MSLPASWRYVSLPQIAEVVGGGTPERSNPNYFGGDIPWITPSDVTKLHGMWIHSSQERLTADGLQKSPAKIVPKGSVLMATRVAVGRAVVAGVDIATNQDFTSLVVDSTLVDSEYLARAIEALSVFLESRAQGSTIKGIPRSTVDRLKVPLPTLPEQKRIVDVLQRAEAMTRLRSDFESLLIRTKRQLFVEMFGDPNPRSNDQWPVVKLGKFVTVATGGTPSREQADSYGSAHAWVKSTDLKDNALVATEERVSALGIQRSNAKIHPAQTVMLAMYGQGQTRGRTGKLLIEAACNQACAALLPSDELLPDYLWVWLQLSYEAVRALGRGGQQENLNLDIVRGITLPKPPAPLQQEFSRRLNGLLVLFEKSTAACAQLSQLQAVLSIEALTGDATAAWREKHAAEIGEAVRTRDGLLRESGARISLSASALATATAQADLTVRPARHWLLGELSDFQRQVLTAFTAYCQASGEPLLVEDPDVFARFCDDTAVTEQLQVFGTSHGNRIRRTLSQLAALGLIAKVTLPKVDPESGERDYLKAFRPLRNDEFTRMADVQTLRKALSADDDHEHYHLQAQLDYETSERAGAGGMFQVISIQDDEGKDFTHLVDQARHYASLDDLKVDLASALKVAANQIELEEK